MSSRSRVEGVRAQSFLLYCALDALPSLSLTSRSSCSIRIAGDSKVVVDYCHCFAGLGFCERAPLLATFIVLDHCKKA
jgi:hypothetical protein